jgi:putative hydrolase
MPNPTPDQPDDADRSDAPFEEFLRSLLGPGAEDALRDMRSRGFDPQALAASADADPEAMQQVLSQIQRMLSTPADGPVNTDVSHDIARQVAVAEGDPVITGAQAHAAKDALSVAELWLDAATEFPPAGGPSHAWSRSEWVEATLPAWNALAAPVAASVADALATVLGEQFGRAGLDDDAPAALPGLPIGALGAGLDPTQLMRRMGSAVFGMQIGQAAGTLSRDVFGATDVGLPLLPGAATVLLPTNVEAFAAGLDAPLDEVRLFLALREAAHARLFTHVAWLRAHLLGLVEAYARGITINLDELESRLSDIDVTDTGAMQKALSGGVFGLQNTPEQKATLVRLETTLALVEGWVDEVTARAALPHLPHAIALREMIWRRRAAGGPAEQTFSALVGLELRPRRARDAATLWRLIEQQSGPDGRDAGWDHPDLLPETVDLDDPTGYADRRAALRADQAEMDRALAQILGEDDPTPPHPDGSAPDDTQ